MNKRPLLEIMSWIAAIVGTLLALYLAFKPSPRESENFPVTQAAGNNSTQIGKVNGNVTFNQPGDNNSAAEKPAKQALSQEQFQSTANQNNLDRYVQLTDLKTEDSVGIMWVRVKATNYTWEKASQFCVKLQSYNYNDWRLPTRRELEVLGQKDEVQNLPIESTDFWCATEVDMSPAQAWLVRFPGGRAHHLPKDKPYGSLICVRNIN